MDIIKTYLGYVAVVLMICLILAGAIFLPTQNSLDIVLKTGCMIILVCAVIMMRFHNGIL